MIRSDLIATFVLIADTGSLNAAAGKLGVSRSVVSERLTALETDLGSRLVIRSTRGLSLTAAGELFLEHARGLTAAMDAARDAVAEADSTLTGPLRIAVPTALAIEWLTPILARFLEANPRISMEVASSDRTIDIVQEGFDLAIRGGRLPSSDLIARKLTSTCRILVCAPAYAEKHGVPRSIAEMSEHPAIIYRNRRITQDVTFRTEHGVRAARVSGRFETDDGTVMREAAIAGVGISLLPTFLVARDLVAGRLIAIDVGAEPDGDTIAAVYPRANRGMPRISALIEHIKTEFGDPPPWDRELAAAGLLSLD
jgi:DNA-binding transcriptional LysR family regulator